MAPNDALLLAAWLVAVAEPLTDRTMGAQMRFVAEGFAELFTSLRQRLPLKTGKLTLGRMKVSQLRESATVLFDRARKRRQERTDADFRRAKFLEDEADAMSPYARAEHNLEYARFLELRASGVTVTEKERTRTAGR
jgi:hypothetical protein